MGQANAARDKLYDLRECDLKGQGKYLLTHSLTYLLTYLLNEIAK
jgi:hypothetical protein